MPKRTEKLSARFVETVSDPGMIADEHGLYLLVKPTGTKSWIFRYSLAGKRREMGLGGFPSVTLASARKLALEHRQSVAANVDPINVRATEVVVIPTFGTFADTYLATMQAKFRNEKHRAQWRMTLTNYAKPLRKMQVNEIELDDILAVLKPIWQAKPETASRLRGRIENVLDAAKAAGHRTGENPAAWRGNLKHLLPARQKLARGHHKAMAYKDVPEFLAALRKRQSLSALVLEFTVLTAARSGESLGARWAEIDLETGVWMIPGMRMKAGKEHQVPLSARTLEILNTVMPSRQSDDGGAFVFPGARGGKPLSSMAMGMLVRGMALDVTVHGFRSAFRDWASETTGFPHEVCEMALAHVIGNKAEAAYRRGSLMQKRRELMDAWAQYCGAKGDNVIPLRRGASAVERI